LSDRDAVDRYAFDVRWRHPPTGRQVLAEHRGQQGGGLPTDSPSVRLVTIVTDTGEADGAPAGLGRSCAEKPRPGNDGIIEMKASDALSPCFVGLSAVR